MTEEDEVYKKAFGCAYENSTIDKAVLDTIIQLENRYTLRGDPHHDNQVLKVLFNEEIFQTKLKTAIDEKSKQEEAFEKLKKAVTGNKKIIKQIEGLKRNKGIAIIGNNYDLISGIASYLWLTSPLICPGIPPIWLMMSPIKQKFFDAIGKYINGKKGFCYINCDGVNETKLYEELFPDLTIMPNLPGSVLFLRNINNSHDNIVKRVLGIMRDVGGQGNFIISTDNLPEDLKDQFEEIELETEKQGRSVSVQQTKAGNVFRWCGGTWEITFDGKNHKTTQ